MKIGIAGLPALTQNYVEALRLVSPHIVTDISLCPSRAKQWDGLLLPGGGDIDPALLPHSPPADPNCRNLDPILDRQQLALLEYFVWQKKPVLGICKGMQLIHLYFCGDLCQHLPTARIHCKAQGDCLHPVHTAPHCVLGKLYSPTCLVNSAHHQGVLGNGPSFGQSCQPAHDLSVIQQAPDGVVEGICHTRLPILGLQWHPERLCGRFLRPGAADGRQIFSLFLSWILETAP